MNFIEINIAMLTQILLKFAPNGPIHASMVQVAAWCRKDDKLLPAPMMMQFVDACMCQNTPINRGMVLGIFFFMQIIIIGSHYSAFPSNKWMTTSDSKYPNFFSKWYKSQSLDAYMRHHTSPYS